MIAVCNNVSDLKDRNLVVTEKLLHQGYRFHKLLKTFTKFYYRYIQIFYINTILHAEIWTKKYITHPCSYGNIFKKKKKS